MSLTPVDFEFVRTLVRTQSAIVIDPGKEYLVEARLAPLTRHEGYQSLEEMIEILRRAPAKSSLTRKVVDAMTTNETSFFRDVQPFEVLKKHILPSLIESRRDVRELNIWCAAASTGQEPYSLSMLIRDAFPQLATWKISFRATDLSRTVLDKARLGRYTQLEVNRGLPVPFLLKYFEKEGVEWQIKDSIRRLVDFEELNLDAAWPKFRPLDLVLIRNVLIYFDVETKKKILNKVHGLMRNDAYMMLGGAETTMNLDTRFVRAPYERAGAYRIGAGIGSIRQAS